MALFCYKSDNDFTLSTAFSTTLQLALSDAGYPTKTLPFTNSKVSYIQVPASHDVIVDKLTDAMSATTIDDMEDWLCELLGHMAENEPLLIRDTHDSYFYYANYTLTAIVSASDATYSTDITASDSVTLDVETECSVSTAVDGATLSLSSATVTSGGGSITDYSDITAVAFTAGSDAETVVLTFVAQDSEGNTSDSFTLTLTIVAS